MTNHGNKTDNTEVILFNRNEPSQPIMSREIRVHDRPVIITHWNAVEGEFLCLTRFNLTGECSKKLAGDIIFVKDCNCEFVCLCCKCPTMKITEPGRYKLIKQGIINNAQVTYKYISNRFACC